MPIQLKRPLPILAGNEPAELTPGALLYLARARGAGERRRPSPRR